MTDSSHYDFVTQWKIPAPLERVWAELMVPENWPCWWRGVQNVELLQSGTDEVGTGAVRRYTWRSRLPYRLSFDMTTTRIQPQTLIEGTATGDLAGRGIWQLEQSNGITHVRYDWHVVANKWWMRRVSWLARPLFEWNHDVVMDWGRQGLIRRLGVDHRDQGI